MPYYQSDIDYFDSLDDTDYLYYCLNCRLYWESCECEECGEDELDTFADWLDSMEDRREHTL